MNINYCSHEDQEESQEEAKVQIFKNKSKENFNGPWSDAKFSAVDVYPEGEGGEESPENRSLKKKKSNRMQDVYSKVTSVGDNIVTGIKKMASTNE